MQNFCFYIMAGEKAYSFHKAISSLRILIDIMAEERKNWLLSIWTGIATTHQLCQSQSLFFLLMAPVVIFSWGGDLDLGELTLWQAEWRKTWSPPGALGS